VRARLLLYTVVTLAAATLTTVGPGPSAGSLTTGQSPNSNAQSRWYKGNLHTHTLNSDGDSTPDDVVRWYREHGYQFLVLTDHNYLTGVDGLNALHGADDKFLVVRGEEVTGTAQGKPVHVNGLDLQRYVEPPKSDTVLGMVQGMVDGVRAAKGAPRDNHPNFGWAITSEEMAQVRNTRLFEVWNGHPLVNNDGGGGIPGLEEMWNRILAGGKMIYGVAVDDAHAFKQPGNPNVPGPGRGWVYVRAPRLDARALIEALERGDFYASTGVELESVVATAQSMTVTVKTQGSSKYRIQFIGHPGRVLFEAVASPATYTFKGDERFVRAMVLESNGKAAWVQPVPVGPEAPK
jgi:hypothetical protein